jgi:GNAT superfamily N-acetyltransferase
MPTPNLSIYPKLLPLRDGQEVAVRPMTLRDEGTLLDFFRRLPEEERFYLKDDVTAPGVIAGWVRALDYERVLPLLAVQHRHIVGDATLHRRRGGAHRHMGEVRVTVDPAWRGRGLGTALLRELVGCASQVGLETLVFELIAEVQDEAIDAAGRAGFLVAARLVNHVKDMQGKPHDLVMMSLLLGKWYCWW